MSYPSTHPHLHQTDYCHVSSHVSSQTSVPQGRFLQPCLTWALFEYSGTFLLSMSHCQWLTCECMKLCNCCTTCLLHCNVSPRRLDCFPFHDPPSTKHHACISQALSTFLLNALMKEFQKMVLRLAI